MQAFLLFVFESVCLIVLSYIFPHEHTAESEALVWKSPLEALRSENAWRGLGDYRVLAVTLVVVMVGFYWWFAGEEYYYPVDGRVTLADGTPVVGAEVVLQTDDPRFNVTLVTDVEGRYAYGTAAALGGAPAGTKYHVRIVPLVRDYLVEMKEDDQGKQVVHQVRASMPSGTVVEERQTDGGTQFVVETREQPIDVEDGKTVKILRATAVPEQYQQFDSSNLEIVVEAGKNHVDLKLAGA